MLKKYRRLLIVILLIMISIKVLSCSLPQVVDQEIFITAHFVPGLCVNDTKGQEYEIIETDAYGRILFTFNSEFLVSGEKEKFHIICQTSNEKGVYYYEDKNYCIVSDDSDIDRLKEQNDWNKELDFSKMSFRACIISFDLMIVEKQKTKIDYFDVKELFIEMLNVDEDLIIHDRQIDTDPEGKCMYMFIVDGMDLEEVYVVISNEEYKLNYTKINTCNEYASQISDLKSVSEWSYKTG